MTPAYDRAAHDYGNIVKLEHVNLCLPDQHLAMLFYITGLGLTRDPYVNVGVNLMWINVGQCQFHLPTGAAQRIRGVTGLVLPDLSALKARLDGVAPALEGTQFRLIEANEGHVDIVSPWGDRLRCHAPDPDRFGPIQLGMPYVEFDVADGTAEGIARFYRTVMDTPAHLSEEGGARLARVPIGRQWMIFRESGATLPPYDGHHIQIYVSNFSGPYLQLRERDLITRETNAFEYRFSEIFDPADGRPLYSLEHEVRTLSHPAYGRQLVNRDPAQQGLAYMAGRDSLSTFLT